MNPKLLALLAAAALLASTPLAIAQGEKDAGKGSDKGSAQGGDHGTGLRLDVRSDGFTYKLKARSADEKTQTKVSFEAPAVLLKLKVQSENATTESAFKMAVKLVDLVEYKDANGDGLYQAGTDPALQTLPLRGIAWSVQGPASATVGGVAVQQVTARGALPGNGSISLVFSASDSAFRAGASQVDPSAVKFDIRLDNFPWRDNASRLALETHVLQKAESEVKDQEGGQGEDRVEARTGAFTGVFRWAANATVDGQSLAVKSSVQKLANANEDEEDNESEGVEAVTLNYAHGAHIEHDPVLGAQSASSSTIPAPGMVAGVAVLGGLALAARRRRA